MKSLSDSDFRRLVGSKDLGSLADQLRHQDFQELENGLNFFVRAVKKETGADVIGVALSGMISSFPDYKGNVTAAQEALSKFSWKQKPEKTQFMSRILSVKEQARYELLSVASFKYDGVAAMDDISGPRIGDARLGEQSFDIDVREALTACNGNRSSFHAHADDKLKELEAKLALPGANKPPVWNPKADCDGAKAEERARQLGVKIEESGETKPSEEKLQQQVMQDFPESFPTTATEEVRLSGGWVASGMLCRGAAQVGLGFCAKPSKSCEKLKDDCDASSPVGFSAPAFSFNKEAACKEHKEKCSFLRPRDVIQKLRSKYEAMKREIRWQLATCSALFDVMYTLIAMEKWFHEDRARLVFTDTLDSVSVSGGTGLALMMMQLHTDETPQAYVYAEYNTNYCPFGSVRVTTQAECSAAASALGTTFDRVGNWPSSVYGCMDVIWKGTLDFNGNTANKNTANDRLVCRVEEVTPAPTAAPTPGQQSSGKRYLNTAGRVLQKVLIGFAVLAICCCCCLVCLCKKMFSSDNEKYDFAHTTVEHGSMAQGVVQPEYLDFQCPVGSGPGDLVEVPLPDGTSRQVYIPDNIYAGMFFSVQV